MIKAMEATAIMAPDDAPAMKAMKAMAANAAGGAPAVMEMKTMGAKAAPRPIMQWRPELRPWRPGKRRRPRHRP